MKLAPGKNRQSLIGSPCSDLESGQSALFMMDRRKKEESCGPAEDRGVLARIIHERFCCIRAFAAAMSLRRAARAAGGRGTAQS